MRRRQPARRRSPRRGCWRSVRTTSARRRETSDTLGWILAKEGQTEVAVPLLRQAAAATVARQRADPAMFYRLAYALRAAGQRDEALRIIEPVVAADVQFPERADAERLLAALRAGG